MKAKVTQVMNPTKQHPYGKIVGLAQDGYNLAQNVFAKLTDAVAIAATKGDFPSKEWEEAQGYLTELLKNLAILENDEYEYGYDEG